MLAATNQDLEQRIQGGHFREDLYYRLNIIRIYIPPLRERPEDIEPLVCYFSGQFGGGGEKQCFNFNDGNVMDFLRAYSWPGNVRELKHTVGRLVLLGDWESVKPELIARGRKRTSVDEPAGESSPPLGSESSNETPVGRSFPPLKEVKKKAIREAESRLISSVLNETSWNRKRAAGILKISYKALLYKIKDYELDRNFHQSE